MVPEVKHTEQKKNVETTGFRADGPTLKQATLDGAAKDEYTELNNFKNGVANICMTISYSLDDTERIPIQNIQ